MSRARADLRSMRLESYRMSTQRSDNLEDALLDAVAEGGTPLGDADGGAAAAEEGAAAPPPQQQQQQQQQRTYVRWGSGRSRDSAGRDSAASGAGTPGSAEGRRSPRPAGAEGAAAAASSDSRKLWRLARTRVGLAGLAAQAALAEGEEEDGAPRPRASIDVPRGRASIDVTRPRASVDSAAAGAGALPGSPTAFAAAAHLRRASGVDYGGGADDGGGGGGGSPRALAAAPGRRRSMAEHVVRALGGTLGSAAVHAEARDAGGGAEPAPPPGLWAPRGDAAALAHMVRASYLNVLLLCVPFGLVAGAAGAGAALVFWVNLAALLPMALIIGEVTEDLAVRFGDAVGGLLNATFGNAVELVLSLAALRRGLYTVVATSLLGSILSNLLLVLGCCFLFGGLRYRDQTFNPLANKVSSSLLFLACISLTIPSSARLLMGAGAFPPAALLSLSHAIALVLIATYGGYLFFQLRTHAEAFAGEASDDACALSLAGAAGALGALTLAVAACSELLTGAIEEVSASTGINQAFLGLIVLPIAGNACEHITAVFVAVKNKMDLAIGVALGSSNQIALFVIPTVVLVGWATGHDFTLDFQPFAVLMLTLSVVLAFFVSSDGSSNWLLGLQLVATYVLIGLVFLLQNEAPPPPGVKAAGL